MRQQLSALVSAVAFLSRLPVPAALASEGFVKAAYMAPLAGVIIALPAAALLVVATALGASPFLAASLAAVTLIVTTGALHEDGLADCADGLWGGATTERRLEIMRDSRVGTYGVLALVAAVLIKVAVLEMALAAGSIFAALMLLGAAATARAVALFPWIGLEPARRDGLAASLGRPTLPAFRKAMAIALAANAALFAWWVPLGAILAIVVAAAAAKACASLAASKIGGHTGDIIGATVVLADLSYLLALTIWLS